MAKRRKFTDRFQAKVTLDALRGDKTIQEIAVKHQVHPNQVSTWKREAVEGMAELINKTPCITATSADAKDPIRFQRVFGRLKSSFRTIRGHRNPLKKTAQHFMAIIKIAVFRLWIEFSESTA